MKTALVFGGSGQIGAPLLDRLGDAGWRVYAVSRQARSDEPGQHWLHGDFAHHADASVLYLHDMAVAPEAKGQGAARALLAAARNLARQRLIRRTALVSVQDSQAYWQGLGYAVEPVTDTLQQQHLRTYGAEAVYMAGEF